MTPPSGPATFLNAARRARELEQLADGERVDVLVVGGGVTGAGIALDCATRGLSVALLERRDLANGTSRWSSKLAHGGLRYLARGEVAIAWESARERHRLAGVIAPHLIRALPQLTPVYGRFPPPLALGLESGIRLGDAMRALSGTSRRRLPPMRRIGAREALLWAPALDPDQLRGAILHWDGQLEDDARLVVAVARTAASYGAKVITYAEVEQLGGAGATAIDVRTGERLEIRARHVINATGVWAGQLAAGIRLRPSKGSHVLVPAERLGRPGASINVPVPDHFGRFVFAVPRSDGLVLIGLTDDPCDGPVPDVPMSTTAEEERFLLGTVSRALSTELTADDVVGRYAGLRPLLAADGATCDISRRHAVIEDPATAAVTVVGGKLTTYRQMAEDAVDVIAARPGVDAGRCRTASLPLVGAQPNEFVTDRSVMGRLIRRYGSEASQIAALAGGRAELLEPIAPGLPAYGIELVVAVEREGALSPADVLDTRTRVGLVPEWREAALPATERLFDAVTA